MAHHWTPLETFQRVGPEEWIVFERPRGRRIAIARVVTIGPEKEKLIRVVTYAERSEDRVLIGYFPHLRIAAAITWQEWMKAQRRAGPVGTPEERRAAGRGDR